MTERFLASENYLDPDVGYLLGMIVGRGSFTESGENRRLVIDFPYSSLRAKGINAAYEQRTHLGLAVNQIRDRIEQLVEADCRIETTRTNVQFIMRFLRSSMTWRNLRFITTGFQNFRRSSVPDRLFDVHPDIQREFVRGLADVCGFVRASNNYTDGRHRVYIQVPAENWRLPISLCHLLQVHLKVPVQCIQWNHPNTRIPNKVKQKLTSREHQVKIFAEVFRQIGFYVDYKQTILEELADFNENTLSTEPKCCNPNPEAHSIRKKRKHPEEKCELIPRKIRGKHFDAYWQICSALGCKQSRPIDPNQQRLFGQSGDAEDSNAETPES